MAEPQPGIALARVIPAGEATAWQDGYRFLDAAKAEAARLRQEAGTALASERQRGRLEGLVIGTAEGAQLLQEAEQLISSQLAALEKDIVLLAIDLAERILGSFDDRDFVRRAAAHALADLRADEGGTIYAAPAQLRALAEHVASISEARQGMIAVEADHAAGPRDCTLLTSRGVMKLDAEAQLEALRSGILGWYSKRSAS